jgi:hypothetical protein
MINLIYIDSKKSQNGDNMNTQTFLAPSDYAKLQNYPRLRRYNKLKALSGHKTLLEYDESINSNINSSHSFNTSQLEEESKYVKSHLSELKSMLDNVFQEPVNLVPKERLPYTSRVKTPKILQRDARYLNDNGFASREMINSFIEDLTGND